MCHLHKQLGLRDEPDLSGNLFVSQRSCAAQGPVCAEKLGADVGLKRQAFLQSGTFYTDYLHD